MPLGQRQTSGVRIEKLIQFRPIMILQSDWLEKSSGFLSVNGTKTKKESN